MTRKNKNKNTQGQASGGNSSGSAPQGQRQHAEATPQQTQQQNPGGPPQGPWQHQNPGGPPQRQQYPRGPPQGPWQQQNPGGPPQRQQYPRGPPQGPWQHRNPGGPPQRQQYPRGPPQGPWHQQNPGGPPQGPWQQQNPGGPPQGPWQQQNPGGPPQGPWQQQNPGGPPHGCGQQQNPGGPHQGPWQQQNPGGPPHGRGQQQNPGGPPHGRGQQQNPGGPPQGPWQQQNPGGPPQKQQNPGGLPKGRGQQQNPGGPPQGPGESLESTSQMGLSPVPKEQSQPKSKEPRKQEEKGEKEVSSDVQPNVESADGNPVEPKAGKKKKKNKQKKAAADSSDLASGMQACALQDSPSEPKALSVKLRPKGPEGYGTNGRRIKVVANHFPLVFTSNKNTEITHMDVSMKNSKGSDKIPKGFKRLIIMKLQHDYPKVFQQAILAYDGEKNVYSSVYQNAMSATFEVDMSDDSRKADKFKVTLKKAGSADISDLLLSIKSGGRNPSVNINALQMLEIMFKEFRARSFVPVGRNSFFPMGDKDAMLQTPLSGGKVAHRGFFSSLRPASWKDGSILMNFDVSNAVFFEPRPLLEHIGLNVRDCDFNRRLQFYDKKRIDKDIKGLKVRTIHNHRNAKVVGLADIDAIQHKFPEDPNRPNALISVKDYFEKTYRTKLRYPKFNLLHVGNAAKKTYMPVELCHIEKAQKVSRKLDPFEVSEFIKTTAVPPIKRLETTKKLFQENEFHKDPILKSLGIQVSNEPVTIEGRILDAPTIISGDGRRSTANNGQWNVDKYHKGGVLTEWILIGFDVSPRFDPSNFIRELVKAAQQKGLRADRAKNARCYQTNRENPENILRNAVREYPNLHMIVTVLGNRVPQNLYNKIKKVCDLELGVPNQCIKEFNAIKCNFATIGNLLHKINGKLDGVNNDVIASPNVRPIRFDQPVMIMGADVNHPPAGGSENIPSVAAVVASQSLNATKYAAEIRGQSHRVEYITDLKRMTMNLLKNFFSKTGHKPVRIIMYRDGVSESQFIHVLSQEMMQIREACMSLEKGYKPAITFICVQKRHHTRLYPKDQRDGMRNGNVPPGTIVDTQIAHPFEMDFYLVSHAGIQGTSRPTHYNVLWDDSDFTMDQIQTLSYYLCHIYYRCNKSVSIPCPVYYAHLAAFRGKTYHESDDTGSVSSRSSGNQSTYIVDVTHKTSKITDRLYFI